MVKKWFDVLNLFYFIFFNYFFYFTLCKLMSPFFIVVVKDFYISLFISVLLYSFINVFMYLYVNNLCLTHTATQWQCLFLWGFQAVVLQVSVVVPPVNSMPTLAVANAVCLGSLGQSTKKKKKKASGL